MLLAASGLSSVYAQPNAPSRVRISSTITAGITLKVVLPRDIGVPGDVVVELLVSKQGQVLRVRGVSGDKRLQKAAKPAVMKWRFSPYYLNGAPVEFLTEWTIRFDGKKGDAQVVVPSQFVPPPMPDILGPKH